MSVKKDNTQQDAHTPFEQTPLSSQSGEAKKSTGKKPAGHKKQKKARKSTASDRETEKDRQQRGVERERVSEQLTEIYENADGSMPDMRYFEKRRRSRLIAAFFTLVFAVMFLGATVIAGFFWLQPSTDFSERDVALSVEAEDEVVVGAPVSLEITYGNEQQVPLTQAELSLRYPEGFVFERASKEPIGEQNNRWAIGALDADERGSITVHGRMYTDIDTKQSVRVFLSYTPSNFSSEFQQVSTHEMVMTDGPADVFIGGPQRVSAGQEVTVTLRAELAAQIAADVHMPSTTAIMLQPSDGFRLSGSEPEPDQFHSNRWTVSLDDKNEIRVTGVVADDVDDFISLNAQILAWNGAPQESRRFIIASTTHEIAVQQSDAAVSLLINGGQEDFSVRPGDWFNTQIKVENTGSEDITDAEVVLTFETPSFDNNSMFDWRQFDDPVDNARNVVGKQVSDNRRQGIITYNSEHIPALASLAPGESHVIDIRLPLETAGTEDLSRYDTHTITAGVKAGYTVAGEQAAVQSAPLTITVNTDADVTTEVDKEEDGADDVYTMTWLLENNLHALKDVSVTADLYGDVRWDEDAITVPAGTLYYNEDTQSVVWELDALPLRGDVLGAEFGFRLKDPNPTQENVTSRTTLHATDVVTGEQILRLAPPVLRE